MAIPFRTLYQHTATPSHQNGSFLRRRYVDQQAAHTMHQSETFYNTHALPLTDIDIGSTVALQNPQTKFWIYMVKLSPLDLTEGIISELRVDGSSTSIPCLLHSPNNDSAESTCNLPSFTYSTSYTYTLPRSICSTSMYVLLPYIPIIKYHKSSMLITLQKVFTIPWMWPDFTKADFHTQLKVFMKCIITQEATEQLLHNFHISVAVQDTSIC